MNKLITLCCILFFLSGCNPTTLKFHYIYNDEGPNREIAERMEQLLEEEFNVDIVVVPGVGTNANLDSLSAGSFDMALVENYVNYQEGVSSAFSVYREILHIFYREDLDGSSFAALMNQGSLYIGRENSPTYNLMMDLLDFYGLNASELRITFDMSQADVIVELTNLFNQAELEAYQGFRLFTFNTKAEAGNGSEVDGISLKYPRTSPFLIPNGTYVDFTDRPIVTLSVDLIMMVRSDMLEVSVNDFVKTMLRNRQLFTSIDPLLFDGLREDFNQSELNFPLHEGARSFLDRDEPSFIERYAELGGVLLSILIASISGLVSLTKWQAQKKKDKIDEFYEELLAIKNTIPGIKQLTEGVQQIRRIQAAQNRAFEMLISEELIANESFRIYMELSKETINEVRSRMRIIKSKQQRSTD